jgi:predicted nuclease of predicted toxin-antitoxin system
MKLLLDQNISYKLLSSISGIFPDSTHVRLEHLEQKTDSEIWEFAKKGGYTIVTHDADFYELALLHGFPPKVIWLRCGNTSTKNIEQILVNKFELIKELSTSADHACLELD